MLAYVIEGVQYGAAAYITALTIDFFTVIFGFLVALDALCNNQWKCRSGRRRIRSESPGRELMKAHLSALPEFGFGTVSDLYSPQVELPG